MLTLMNHTGFAFISLFANQENNLLDASFKGLMTFFTPFPITYDDATIYSCSPNFEEATLKLSDDTH